VHHVALSVVGTERLGASGCFRGKMVQEELIRASGRSPPSDTAGAGRSPTTAARFSTVAIVLAPL
jgi:hypothetical protein